MYLLKRQACSQERSIFFTWSKNYEKKYRRQLLDRTWQWCGLYFCTKKKVKEHVNSCHKQPNPSSNSVEMHNVRPSRILTRRSIGRSKKFSALCAKMMKPMLIFNKAKCQQLTCKMLIQLLVLKNVLLIRGPRTIYIKYIYVLVQYMFFLWLNSSFIIIVMAIKKNLQPGVDIFIMVLNFRIK